MLLYDDLVQRLIAIQTNDTSDLVKTTDYNTKFEEIERKFQLIIVTLLLMILANFHMWYLMKEQNKQN